jgi:hypothetical protein
VIKPRRMRWVEHVASMGEMRTAYIIFLVGKSEGKKSLGRSGRRWEDNIRMDLGEIGLADVDRVRLSSDRDQWRVVVNPVMKLRIT